MKNNNVCIIGNDPSLLESSKGKLIDSEKLVQILNYDFQVELE